MDDYTRHVWLNGHCLNAKAHPTAEIHTGGRETGDFPPLSKFPPLLNQHKYYNKVVLTAAK